MKTTAIKILNLMRKKNLVKIIRNTLVVGFFIFILLYVILNTRLISKGVKLSVLGVTNGTVYEEGALPITGNASRARHVLINGREINIDQAGDFSDTLVLLPGYNIITISAEDKFGKVTKQVFDIIRKEVISLESSSQGSL